MNRSDGDELFPLDVSSPRSVCFRSSTSLSLLAKEDKNRTFERPPSKFLVYPRSVHASAHLYLSYLICIFVRDNPILTLSLTSSYYTIEAEEATIQEEQLTMAANLRHISSSTFQMQFLRGRKVVYIGRITPHPHSLPWILVGKVRTIGEQIAP